MKYFSSFFILCALATSSCEKKESAQTQAPQHTPAPARNASGIQLKSELATIAQHLDTNGEHFSVTKTAGDLEAFCFILDAALSVVPKEELGPDFNLSLRDTLQKSGLDHIVAKGESSNYTDDHWHNRTFYAVKGPRQGLLSLLGHEAIPFQGPSFAPANTDLLLETELNLKELKSLSEHIASSFGQEPKRSFAEAMQQKLMGIGMTTGDILGKFNAHLSLALTTHPTETWQSTLEGPELPIIDFVVRVDGVNWLWDEYGEALEKNATVREEGNKKHLSFGDNTPTPMGEVSPIILIDNDANQTWVALQNKTLQACLSEDSPKLAQSQHFQSALKGLPKKGNSLSFTSKNLYEVLARIPLEESGAFENEEQLKAVTAQISTFMIRSKAGYASVIANQKDGIMIASNSPLSNKNGGISLMTASAAIIPTLFIGANTYKEGADRSACIINIRNIQHAIRANQNINAIDTGTPIDFSEIFGPENYLERPTCPLGNTYTISETYPEVGTVAAKCAHPEHQPKNTEGW